MSTNSRRMRNALFLLLSCMPILIFGSLAYGAEAELDHLRKEIGRRGAGWQAGETSVSKMAPEQRKRRLGLNMEQLQTEQAGSTVTLEDAPPLTGFIGSSSLDWRNYGYVSRVRDQGDCGGCWAFAAVATLESKYLMLYWPQRINISEQALISCGRAGDCSGGSHYEATKFISDVGLPWENCFPYTALNTECSLAACPNWFAEATHGITGWHWVATTTPTVSALRAALKTYGPLVTTMQVFGDYYYYRSGIYSYAGGDYEGPHAVQLVGYDNTNRYFIVKNSWGTDWGEAGFFRISYDELNSVVEFGRWTIAYEGYTPIVSAPTCTRVLNKTGVTRTASGGRVRVTVTTDPGCPWNTKSLVPWVWFVSRTTAAGSGTVEYWVEPNYTGKTRTGYIKVAGQYVTIAQTWY